MNLFEYSTIRVVPDIEREEFVNVGLVMMCKRRRWIRLETFVDADRIHALSPHLDIEQVRQALSTFTHTSAGAREAGPLAELETEERFRWLTAVKSCMIQTSRPHAGLTDNLDATFEQIFNRLVLYTHQSNE